MRDGSELQRIVRQWWSKAEDDLASAGTLLRAGKRTQADNICFHVQQAVEKYIKALLVQNRIGFPKTHSIRELIALLPAADVPNLEDAFQDRLTDYAIVIRYPGEEERISLHEAEAAVRIDRRVRTFFCERLAEEGA